MNNGFVNDFDEENLVSNNSSGVVATGHSEMNEEHGANYDPFIIWRMILPDEMASRIGWPDDGVDYRNLDLFTAIELLPSLRGARIEIEGDFE